MAYAELGLPKAPAIMIGSEIITEGKDIDEAALEAAINCHLRPSPSCACRKESIL